MIGLAQIHCHHWLLAQGLARFVVSAWRLGAHGLMAFIKHPIRRLRRKALLHQTFRLPQRLSLHTIGALREALADVDLRIVNQPLPQLTPFP